MADLTASIQDSFILTDVVAKQYDTHTFYDDRVLYNGEPTVLRVLDYSRPYLDSISVSDSLTNSLLLIIDLLDTLELSDLATRNTQTKVNIADSVSLDDEVLAIRTFLLSLLETVLFSDSLQRQFFISRVNLDNFNVQDFLERDVIIGVSIIDTIGVSESATRQFIASRTQDETLEYSDYIQYVYSNSIDNSQGPTLEALILTPLPYAEPERNVIYAFNEEVIANVEITSFPTIGIKMYDTHTFYDKHIPYYSGVGSDLAPTSEIYKLEPSLLTPS